MFEVGVQNVHPVRVLIKTILLFVVANLAIAFFNPPVGKISIYNWLVPGRLRFPYNQTRSFIPIVHAISVSENFDAMFASHAISMGLKPLDEYRVVLLGDSSTWGFELSEEDSLTEQINWMQLTTCSGLRVRAYNLAFPVPSALRDLLLVEKAQDYQPDLFVWLVTIDAFVDTAGNQNSLPSVYAPELEALARRYEFNIDMSGIEPTSFWEKTFVGQRSTLHKIALLQLLGLPWTATGVDSYVRISEAPPVRPTDDPAYDGFPSEKSKDRLLASFVFNVLPAVEDKSKAAALLIVNEPIHALPGYQNSVRYNKAFPHWAYDAYHEALGTYMRDHGLPYLDLWDFLPDSGFLLNSSLHPSQSGEQMLADRLAPEILQSACP